MLVRNAERNATYTLTLLNLQCYDGWIPQSILLLSHVCIFYTGKVDISNWLGSEKKKHTTQT